MAKIPWNPPSSLMCLANVIGRLSGHYASGMSLGDFAHKNPSTQ